MYYRLLDQLIANSGRIQLNGNINCWVIFFFYQQWIKLIKRDTLGVSQPVYKTHGYSSLWLITTHLQYELSM